MKIVFKITAMLNLLLVVLSFVCVVMGAINKGMPIEQVQKLLGHSKVDTTLEYALVDQENVKISHNKYLT